MFVNPGFIKNKYQCNKLVAHYLTYDLGFPILGIDGKKYYFTDNALLRESLQNLPLWLKIVSRF